MDLKKESKETFPQTKLSLTLIQMKSKMPQSLKNLKRARFGTRLEILETTSAEASIEISIKDLGTEVQALS